MKAPDHAQQVGNLVVSLHGLEFLLRAFLQSLANAEPLGGLEQEGMYSSPVGSTVPECAITNYDSLDDLIRKYNNEMIARGLAGIDATIVSLRDALAHGRVSAIAPERNMRIVKFARPKQGRVRVEFNEIMNDDWFRREIRRVSTAAIAVAKQSANVSFLTDEQVRAEQDRSTTA